MMTESRLQHTAQKQVLPSTSRTQSLMWRKKRKSRLTYPSLKHVPAPGRLRDKVAPCATKYLRLRRRDVKQSACHPAQPHPSFDIDQMSIPQGAPQVVEKRVHVGVDATLLGTNNDDQPAQEPEPSSFGGSEVRTRKRVAPKARPSVASRSPPQTRARSRLNPADPPKTAPSAPRATSRAKDAAAAAASATTSLDHNTESQVVDEFKAHSDDEGDMHEVEADLQIGTESRGVSQITPDYYPPLLTSRHLLRYETHLRMLGQITSALMTSRPFNVFRVHRPTRLLRPIPATTKMTTTLTPNSSRMLEN
jgi:hypothetical protein